MIIQYIKHSDIDFNKWDDCIGKSLNGIIYAYSWYLNIVGDQWDALVGDDYKVVFPLVKKRKFGITYIYQPLFAQQLGAFSTYIIDKEALELLIDSIPLKYKYQEINLNLYNRLDSSKFIVQNRVTYQLDLVQPYFSLSSNYSENTRRNVSKAISMGVYVKKGLPIHEFIEFKKRNLIVSLKDKQVAKLNEIMHISIEKKNGEVYAAYSESNELCAAAFFIRSNGKVIYLSAASSSLGKNNRAMFALVDRFINDYSESHLVLDFEGSSIENIARFYAGFGAIRCNYQQYRLNRLPWFLKPFKR